MLQDAKTIHCVCYINLVVNANSRTTGVREMSDRAKWMCCDALFARFGQKFVDRVANPKDMILFHRRRQLNPDHKGSDHGRVAYCLHQCWSE